MEKHLWKVIVMRAVEITFITDEQDINELAEVMNSHDVYETLSITYVGKAYN